MVHRDLGYADKVNQLDGIIDTIKKRNRDALVVASKPTGLEANADKTKYMVISGDQNAGRRSHSIKTDNGSFEKVEQLNV